MYDTKGELQNLIRLSFLIIILLTLGTISVWLATKYSKSTADAVSQGADSLGRQLDRGITDVGDYIARRVP